MRIGKEFEVDYETYMRAKENNGYMTTGDQKRYFTPRILCGYGLYSCKVREEDGKYICSYMTGSSCD